MKKEKGRTKTRLTSLSVLLVQLSVNGLRDSSSSVAVVRVVESQARSVHLLSLVKVASEEEESGRDDGAGDGSRVTFGPSGSLFSIEGDKGQDVRCRGTEGRDDMLTSVVL